MEAREQLLEATVRVVCAHGWHGATTRRIAEAAGVNEVTIFRQFGSKDALISEAMEWNAARAPLASLPDEPGPDVPAELLAWATQHYEHLVEMRGHLRRSIGEFELHPEAAAAWPRRVPGQLSARLEHYLVRLRDTGRAVGTWDPRASVSMFLGTLFAVAIGRELLPDRLPPSAEAPRRYLDLFLNAIGYSSVSS